MKHILKFKRNINRIDADAAAKELERLARNHKALTPRIVIDAARNPASALHDAFDWDDSSAAEKWRLYQARELIRSVHVVCEREAPRAIYVHVGEAEGYQPIETVIRNPGMFASALREAHARLEKAREAIVELESAAKADGNEGERLARIALAVQAMETAKAAVASLH
ncbi:MAG: hypothetical protein N2690_01105 [Rhodocyclaceae bacterium]|nr:hypothetical protein [Rhodocyclaceae bacterium]